MSRFDELLVEYETWTPAEIKLELRYRVAELDSVYFEIEDLRKENKLLRKKLYTIEEIIMENEAGD